MSTGVGKQTVQPADLRRVAIFRALQLGDLLYTVPAIRSLRKALPCAEIHLIGLPWAFDFVDRYSSYLDGFIEFPGFPGLPEREPDLAAFPEFIANAQRQRFDLVVQMHGSGNLVNSLCALLGSKRLAGYYLPGEYCPDPERFIIYPSDRHEVLRHLSLAQSLGATSDDQSLEFPLTPHDHADLAKSLSDWPLVRGQYVCIHPGARYLSRRWPPERFAAVADDLVAAGYEVVLTGSLEESGLTAQVADHMTGPCVNLAGRTTLGGLAALIDGAALVITNDTGASHMAAALRTPSVVIVLGSDAARWAPLDRLRHRVVSFDVPCRPCEHRVCPIDFPCANRLSWQAVARAAHEMLASYSDLHQGSAHQMNGVMA